MLVKEEVEMEDIDEEEVAEDIDSCDANDPLAVVEYVDDIYIYYRKVEVIYLSSFIWKTFKGSYVATSTRENSLICFFFVNYLPCLLNSMVLTIYVYLIGSPKKIWLWFWA